ncbi:MAG: aldo/keto reductase [Myxococcota bacterium]|nr:aldo/keto reductase [Myxococcota bacterium]
MSKTDTTKKQATVTRRRFLKASGTMAALAGGAVAGCGAASTPQPAADQAPPPSEAGPQGDVATTGQEAPARGITRFRTLGRTGFEVSDISMGCGRISEANVVRFAYDQGVNFFDVAESYGNGDSERRIGEAMPHMDREKIFIVTKLKIEETDTEQTIRDRFGKCLERLKTEYVDALYPHAVSDLKQLSHPGFHSAVDRLKKEGRLKHAGISCHGPREPNLPSMSEILLKAVDDGRFDLMLLVYNFLKPEEGEQVLKACKEKNIGTTGMKAYAGRIELDPFDPDNPSDEFKAWIEALMERRHMTRKQAVAAIQERMKAAEEELTKNRPAVDAFRAKYGLDTQKELDKASVKWVLNNPDMHTVCVAMPTFDEVDQFIPLSGKELTAQAAALLRDYEMAFGNRYCRHGCTECTVRCPHGVPVSTVMRYLYYFSRQGREKLAMKKYADLGALGGVACYTCDAPCLGSCPYGVQIQASLTKAHSMLTLA